MRLPFPLLGLTVLVATVLLAQTPPPTRFERSGGTETPRLEETMAECRSLAKASPWVSVTTFGRSPEGRDLPLLIVDKDRHFDPASAKASGKAIVMIQACIHAGESEGKDAGILFLRDLVLTKKYVPLLDRLTFLFIPVFNVDGHEHFGPFNRINQNGPKEMGWRTNATNLNLNREYLKADAPEVRAWLKLYQAWLPDFFLDCHTTDGADYQYVMTYGAETVDPESPQVEARLGAWIRNTYLAEFEKRMNQDGLPVFPYVKFKKWHDPRSGLVIEVPEPFLSHGYQSLQNRPGMLLETHMLKPYKVRVEATLAALHHTADILHRERDTLLRLNRQADAFTASKAFREKPLALAFVDTGVSETVAFKGFEYTQEKSDLTGGDWFKYDNTKPTEFQIACFKQTKVTASALLPEGYIIPAEWTEVIARLDFHGIRYHRLKTSQKVMVSTDAIEKIHWLPEPYNARMGPVGYQPREIHVDRLFAPGSAVVPTSQRTARVMAQLLEPASNFALLRWGFFNSALEQQEYAESYVMEGLAREMLEQSPALKAEFEQKKAEDKAFAADPEAILNWFYARSRYWDQRVNVYPVGRIRDEATLKGLMTK